MITYLAPGEVQSQDEVEVTGAGYRHLFRARRLAQGARLRVVDGLGGARWGTVAEVTPTGARLILDEAAPTHEPNRHFTLTVAALRPERASWLVEKATELGVSAIRFVATERTPRTYGQGRLERLRRVAASSLVQCHRARLPEISGVYDWEGLTGGKPPAEGSHGIVLDPGGETSWELPSAGDLDVWIGPEGGWSESELQRLSDLGYKSLSFGPRILRVETAALAFAARWAC